MFIFVILIFTLKELGTSDFWKIVSFRFSQKNFFNQMNFNIKYKFMSYPQILDNETRFSFLFRAYLNFTIPPTLPPINFQRLFTEMLICNFNYFITYAKLVSSIWFSLRFNGCILWTSSISEMLLSHCSHSLTYLDLIWSINFLSRLGRYFLWISSLPEMILSDCYHSILYSDLLSSLMFWSRCGRCILGTSLLTEIMMIYCCYFMTYSNKRFHPYYFHHNLLTNVSPGFFHCLKPLW